MIDEERPGGEPPGGPASTAEAAASRIGIGRVYEPPSAEDGTRVLVDRLWPRGVSKEAAGIDEWARDLAPSDALRRWFGHDPARWEEFARRFRRELDARPGALDSLLAAARQGAVTLVYGARDERHNQAVVLREIIEERLAKDCCLSGRPGSEPRYRPGNSPEATG